MNTILHFASLLRSNSSAHRREADSKNKTLLFILLLVSLLFVFSQGGGAATILVTTNVDSGPGSLRAAITAANANANPDLIKINFGGGIQLASALPDLLHEVQIIGSYTTILSVEPKPGVNCRIFTVAAGATVTISDMTIRNGVRTVGGDGVGGGIHNSGKLTLLRCEIHGNQALGANNPSGNGGTGRGGGIYNHSNGTLIVDHCTIAENRAEGGSGNADSGHGGSGEGGGIYNLGRLTILSSTLSGNVTEGGTGEIGGAAYGGGLFSGVAPVNPVLVSCTISNNTGLLGGGGVYAPQACTARNTILAGNSALGGPEYFGSLNSQDYNLIAITSGCTISGKTSHNIINTPAKIGPLENNGGPTRTHALLDDSPARGKGDNAILNAPLNITTDQRLLTRKRATNVDIGAFESGASEVRPEDFNGDGKPDFTLFRSSDRKTALWYLTGTAFASSAYGPTPPPGWQLVDCGDFNRDGQSDFLLFNSSTRQTAVWFMANATLTGSSYGPTLPEGWTLVGAADVTVVSKAEYLLFNPATRQTAIWYLDRTLAINNSNYGPSLTSGWSLVGMADFDDDDDSDYLLYHAATRKTAVWYLDGFNGYAFDHGAYGPTAPSGWEVVGFADFNSNDNPDLVLFKASTRETAIWYLDGTTRVSSAYGPTLPSGWQLISP